MKGKQSKRNNKGAHLLDSRLDFDIGEMNIDIRKRTYVDSVAVANAVAVEA